ncbi:MAG: hypothetical protein GY703_17135 [Gammaproteobacteria bacterium]|nr:hypothetical protein [Gammaproteobacteria bacterium]
MSRIADMHRGESQCPAGMNTGRGRFCALLCTLLFVSGTHGADPSDDLFDLADLRVKISEELHSSILNIG